MPGMGDTTLVRLQATLGGHGPPEATSPWGVGPFVMGTDSPQGLVLNAALLIEVLEEGGGALLHHLWPPCPQVGHEPLQEPHEALSHPDAARNCLCGAGTAGRAQMGSPWHSPHTPRRGSGTRRVSVLIWRGGCGAPEAGVGLGAPQRAQGGSPPQKGAQRPPMLIQHGNGGGGLGGTSKEGSPPHAPCRISSGSTGLAR